MAIEKALYELPQGLEAIAAAQEPLEIEVEDPLMEMLDRLEAVSYTHLTLPTNREV